MFRFSLTILRIQDEECGAAIWKSLATRTATFKMKECFNRTPGDAETAMLRGGWVGLDLKAKAWWGAWWWRTGQSWGCASRRRSRWQLARRGRSGGRADLCWRWGGGVGVGTVVRWWWWRWRVNRPAGLSIGCGRLFFHPCKVDASTLKGRTERFCYGLLIGQNPNIFTAIG